jgi:hypothetical protein
LLALELAAGGDAGHGLQASGGTSKRGDVAYMRGSSFGGGRVAPAVDGGGEGPVDSGGGVCVCDAGVRCERCEDNVSVLFFFS